MLSTHVVPNHENSQKQCHGNFLQEITPNCLPYFIEQLNNEFANNSNLIVPIHCIGSFRQGSTLGLIFNERIFGKSDLYSINKYNTDGQAHGTCVNLYKSDKRQTKPDLCKDCNSSLAINFNKHLNGVLLRQTSDITKISEWSQMKTANNQTKKDELILKRKLERSEDSLIEQRKKNKSLNASNKLLQQKQKQVDAIVEDRFSNMKSFIEINPSLFKSEDEFEGYIENLKGLIQLGSKEIQSLLSSLDENDIDDEGNIVNSCTKMTTHDLLALRTQICLFERTVENISIGPNKQGITKNST